MGLRRAAQAIKTKVEQGQQAQLDNGIPADRLINQAPGRTLPPASATARGGVMLSNANPQPNGTADPGASADASRADHVHANGGTGTLNIDDGATTVGSVTDLTLIGATIADDGGGAATLTVIGSAPDYIHIVESQASGTDGGTFSNGAWQTRVLNTEKADTGNHASVASNQITLAAGTYRVQASAPGYQCGRHQTRLYDISNSAVLLTGTSEHTAAFCQTRSFVVGRITLAGSTIIELQHRCETSSATFGLGVASGSAFTVAEEIYGMVELWKE